MGDDVEVVGGVGSLPCLRLESSTGEDMLTFAPKNSYGFVVFSSPKLS